MRMLKVLLVSAIVVAGFQSPGAQAPQAPQGQAARPAPVATAGEFPAAWRPTVYGKQGMVTAGHPAAAEAGMRIPDDVSVVGFDDLPMARFAYPAVTTVYQNTTRAGELLVDALLKQIREEPIESQMIPASLIVRKSSGVVPEMAEE